MLETDIVDEDYFTPNTSTSLANIFSKNEKEQENENPSLKYVANKVQNLTAKPEETKATQCIFACALFGYEWYENKYTSKGKLGFAIVKILSSGDHNIVIYDSNKKTLSCTLITPKVEINVEGDIYLSFYDSLNKYWSLNGRQDEIAKLVDALKNINATVKFAQHSKGKGPPIPEQASKLGTDALNELDIEERVSDTDKSTTSQRKMSLLSRIASMGQSVLPPQSEAMEKSSQSSDNDSESSSTDSNKHISQLRHKSIKNLVKRTKYQDKYFQQVQKDLTSQSVVEIPQKDNFSGSNMPLFTYINGQLMSLNGNTVTNVNSNNSNDINFLMSEQRICNSELRINMNRISEKVDVILEKVKNTNSNDSKTKMDFQMSLTEKLIGEYERKIKTYEDFMRSNGMDLNKIPLQTKLSAEIQNIETETELYKNKITKLEEEIRSKNTEIKLLKESLFSLQEKTNKEKEEAFEITNNLKRELSETKCSLENKSKEVIELIKNYDDKTSKLNNNDPEIANKIKTIMNDAYRAISANFESTESYKGEYIKNVTASIIKQITIDSLN